MRRLTTILLFLSAVVGFSAISMASSFQVAPVRLTLTPGQTTASLTITANCSEKRTLQLDAVAWSQQDGKDVYRPTNDLLVTPPIFELKPGETRIVRIGLHHAAPGNTETAYRLYIREVPPPLEPGFKGIRVALRIGIPVFVEPKNAAQPSLQWRAQRLARGGLRLELSNSGKAHAHIAELRLNEAGGKASQFVDGGAIYLLPGESRQWQITPAAAARLPHERVQLLVTTDQGQQLVGLPVEGL